jgi:hypothetical protein
MRDGGPGHTARRSESGRSLPGQMVERMARQKMVIGLQGGTVIYPDGEEERFRAFIKEGTFELPTIVQIAPVGDLRTLPYQGENAALSEEFDQFFEMVDAVDVTFTPDDAEHQPKKAFDVSVPFSSSEELDPAAFQYLATQVITFRNHPDGSPRYELTTVDTAHYDAVEGLVVSDASVFDGLLFGGSFGILRVKECVGYALGWASVGDYYGGEAAGWVGGGMLGLLPSGLRDTAGNRFKIPIPCNTPVAIKLYGEDDNPVDTGKGCSAGPGPDTPEPPPVDGGSGMCEVGRDEIVHVLGALSPVHEPPTVVSSSVEDGETDVDPLAAPSVAFGEEVTVPDNAVKLRDDRGNLVRGRVEVSGTTMTFVPEIRLKYGKSYTFDIGGVLSGTADALPARTITFTTFAPVILQHIDGIDARDVAWIDPTAWSEGSGPGPCTDLIAVAEGDGIKERPYSDHGILIYDVTDLSEKLEPIAEARSSGIDRALVFKKGQAFTTTDGVQLTGPYLMSVDGPGGAHIFGAWRLFDLAV